MKTRYFIIPEFSKIPKSVNRWVCQIIRLFYEENFLDIELIIFVSVFILKTFLTASGLKDDVSSKLMTSQVYTPWSPFVYCLFQLSKIRVQYEA